MPRSSAPQWRPGVDQQIDNHLFKATGVAHDPGKLSIEVPLHFDSANLELLAEDIISLPDNLIELHRLKIQLVAFAAELTHMVDNLGGPFDMAVHFLGHGEKNVFPDGLAFADLAHEEVTGGLDHR